MKGISVARNCLRIEGAALIHLTSINARNEIFETISKIALR